ncbi:MAG: hypothetical protein ABEL51_09785, partial [Salinibacter sp.]
MISPERSVAATTLLFALFIASIASPALGQSPPDTSVAMEVEMAPVEVTATPFRIATEAASFAASVRTRSDAA